MFKHHTRARMLLALGQGRGPVLRDAPDDTGGTDTSGGGGGTGQGDPADNGKEPTIDGDLDKDRAAKAIAAARASETKAKDRAAAAEQKAKDVLDQVAVALGLKPDPKTDASAIAAQAAKELTASRAELRAAKVENALLRLAGPAGGDVEALRDSRGFIGKLADLDPEDSDFDTKVTAAVKDAVKANPKLAATTTGQGPGRMGTDVGGSGQTGRQRPTSLGDAVKAAYTR